MTSRGRILDAVEGISNLIAMSSHLRELITEKLQNETLEGRAELDFIREMVLLERRELMQKFEDKIKDCDEHTRCLLKHAIAYYGYSGELADADTEFLENAKRGEEILNTVISFISGEPPIFCSRCLNDRIDSKQDPSKLLDLTNTTNGTQMMQETEWDHSQ